MRTYIRIVEDQSIPQPVLVGNPDVPGIAALLDKVTDVSALQAGFTNLANGASLAMPQQVQMALAFISLLDADQPTRQKLLTKLQGVRLVTPPPAATDQSDPSRQAPQAAPAA